MLAVLGALFATLAVGSMIRLAWLRNNPSAAAQDRLQSLRTWWLLTLLLALAMLLGKYATLLGFAALSGLALRELIRLLPLRPGDASMRYLAGAILVGQYIHLACARAGSWTAAELWLPLGGMLVMTGYLVLRGETRGFVSAAASLSWGLMLVGYCLSFAPRLMFLPQESNPVAGGAGWMLYLILLTESNDIAQALVGRAAGRRKITPSVSPNKTWEGVGGGLLITVVLAVLLAPWLTPFLLPGPLTIGRGWLPAGAAAALTTIRDQWGLPAEAILSGIVISLAGFLGDITMSAVKRDAGVKDSSQLLPGQGGILDRIDSLNFTAPLFYLLIASNHATLP